MQLFSKMGVFRSINSYIKERWLSMEAVMTSRIRTLQIQKYLVEENFLEYEGKKIGSQRFLAL
jgi:hypothetical protein